MHRTGSHETALVSEIPYIIIDENVIIAPWQGKKQFQFYATNFEKSNNFLIFPLGVNLAMNFLEMFQYVLLGTLIKDC